MSPRLDKQKSELIDRIAAQAQSRLKGAIAAAVESFIRHYYEHVPPQDIVEENADGLYGAALAHWKYGASRTRGQAKVRVYNPELEERGWTADHTVVEMVNDDMPFLVDSVTAALTRLDLTVFLVIHPIVKVRRDAGGALLEVADEEAGDENVIRESFMHIEVNHQSGIERLEEIRAAVAETLEDVRVAVDDWQPMQDKMKSIIKGLGSHQAGMSDEDFSEARDFLTWASDDNFTFLGYRDYDFKGEGEKSTVVINPSTGLGVLRDADVRVFKEFRVLGTMPVGASAFIQRSDLLMVVKSNLRSKIHRPVYMDAIGIRRINAKGKVVGERLFTGIFTSAAYHRSVRDIPLLRRKLQKTLDRAGFLPASHDSKALVNILETYPRDELFQSSEDHLFDTATGILHLQERQRVALFIRRDDFERFISCLIYVPRDRYSTDLRQRMQVVLEKAFAGEVSEYFTHLGNSPLARLHVVIQTTPGQIPAYDADAIEDQLVEVTRSWTDVVRDALIAARGEERGLRLFRRYGRAFDSSYRERFNADFAVSDIAKLEESLKSGAIGMSLYRPIEAGENQIRFKIYHPRRPIPLSDVLPMLEHMGLKVVDEIPYAIHPESMGTDLIMIHDFGLETRDGSEVALGAIRENFEDTFRRVWSGELESDGFNCLVLTAGLTWREVIILRAYCKYLRQAGITFSQAYMWRTLSKHAALARLIVNLFMARFDPALDRDADKRTVKILDDLNAGLDAVTSADEDRIVRRFINLVEATLRTNFFQTAEDGGHKSHVSFKLDSRQVDELPLPRPKYEVFVYSPRVEAIHLRGGTVARGGIRWSDRREDFRTEILGLMKAQMVKNVVIVPVGSKGGFVVKRPPEDGTREAVQAEGIECYKTLIRGLLDITDNLKGSEVVPPVDVVRRDGNDPYLVVAADKGTATFSDIANEVSKDYGFWLGDAFASGGSQGYDHKEMGITARGAWESVKRHFREMGRNTQKEDFTVVGVGDMAGDVFGNGMLLSPHIKLVAAFNHQHIFIDPDPDPATSFAERQRLFEMPRSAWDDYSAKVLSAGGAIFERRAKNLTLTPEIKACFGIAKDKITPAELIRVLLKADIDLLWFGGIGTYVKESDESDAEAGDRANDALRIDADELRCKVVGEGANLALTHRARIEYALAGGRIIADSVDNSAGVDCSDHEVNIKILLNAIVTSGDMTEKQRNVQLADMTEEVGDLVLRDNYLQTQAISVANTEGPDVLDPQVRLMRMLEKAGRINREVEFLPDDETIAERIAAKRGLTNPEISVLMPHSKIWLYDELLASDLPDDPQLVGDLVRYFPTPLRDKYRDAIGEHRLRREIIATVVTNSIINRVGGTFVTRLMENTGLSANEIARAYIIARDSFAVYKMWAAIEALDDTVSASVQIDMLIQVNRLIERVTLWFLRNAPHPLDIGANVEAFQAGEATLATCFESVLPEHYRTDHRQRANALVEQGVPEDLALDVAGLNNLASGCDIVRLAQRHGGSVVGIAQLYYALGARLRMGRMRAAAEKLEARNHWQQLAAGTLMEDLYAHQAALTSQALEVAGTEAEVEDAIDAWSKINAGALERTEALLSELWAAEAVDFSMLAVASRQLQALTQEAVSS